MGRRVREYRIRNEQKKVSETGPGAKYLQLKIGISGGFLPTWNFQAGTGCPQNFILRSGLFLARKTEAIRSAMLNGKTNVLRCGLLAELEHFLKLTPSILCKRWKWFPASRDGPVRWQVWTFGTLSHFSNKWMLQRRHYIKLTIDRILSLSSAKVSLHSVNSLWNKEVFSVISLLWSIYTTSVCCEIICN